MAENEKGFQIMKEFVALDYTLFGEKGVKRTRIDGIRIMLIDDSEQEFRFPEPVYPSLLPVYRLDKVSSEEASVCPYPADNEFVKDRINNIIDDAICENFGSSYAGGAMSVAENIIDELIKLGVLSDEKENEALAANTG